MRYKIIISFLVAFLGAYGVAFAQPAQFTPMTAQGYQMKRIKADSTLHIPSFCGVPTIKGSTAIDGAIAIDTCGNILYKWTRAAGWSQITGGGGPTDTTSLSNRINGKVDSIKRFADSVKYYKNGVAYFAFLDSVGGSTIDTTSLSNRINGKVDSIKRFADSVKYYKNGVAYFAFLDSVGTNPPPFGYYGSFIDTTTQTAAVINTAYPVKLGFTQLSNGVSIVNNLSGNPTRITIDNAGIYNIQFSLQLEKTGGSGNMTTDIWLRKNGVNVPNTTGKVVLTGSANASPTIAAWNYVIDASSNDYFELMWATSNVNVEIVKNAAIAPHPLVPSAILTVTQQSGIMAGTGISPLDTAAMLANYLTGIDTASLSNRINTKLNATDTASLSNRINTKLNITDTTVFQPKQLRQYSFMANGTSAAANGAATYYKDTSGTYTGTITWNGTAPSGATNHSYRWTRIGRMVNLSVTLIYATGSGTNNTQVLMTLPTDCPTPIDPTGLGAATDVLYSGTGHLSTSLTTLSLAGRFGVRSNAADNGYELIAQFGSGSALRTCFINIVYYTNQ